MMSSSETEQRKAIEAYRYQLMGYGPFDIPKKKHWIILGSGPSSDDYAEELLDEDTGIIALNSAFRPLKYTTVSIQSHYEDCYLGWYSFHKVDLVFIADPLHLGYRCIPASAMNLFNYDDIAYFFPFKVRFFEKEMDLNRAFERTHTLFCKASIISAAVHLLWRNGVKEAFYCGIDGGYGRGSRYKDIEVYNTKGRTFPNYDAAGLEMNWLAGKLKMDLKPLKKPEAVLA